MTRKFKLKSVLINISLAASIIALVISSAYIINYYTAAKKSSEIINNSRKIWHNTDEQAEEVDQAFKEKTKLLLAENEDFMGWITISNTQVDNPIYKTDNNDFYLTRNQKKQKSAYGALFFDYNNNITEKATDKNLVIYGHEMKNGSMFGTLKKLRSLDFYKQNSTIEFSTLYSQATYKIYSIYVLNSVKADDNNYIYDFSKKLFLNEADFDEWANEAFERSLINTGVDVKLGDDIITLVTCCNDFRNARLVVMARKIREDESPVIDTKNATINENPRYPKIWYNKRNLEYPF